MKRFFFATCLLLGVQCGLWAQSYVPERNNPKFKVKPVVALKAYAFDLKDVRILNNSPFRAAMAADSGYLLYLDPNRLLYRFYKNAGLPTKGDIYGGWESDGLSGHTLGHYLSACSMMYASTGNPAFKKKVNYIVDELARCQDARKTGYVGAIPNEDSIFGKVGRGEIKSSGFDLNGGWSPWYTVHKVMAGLLDSWLYCDNAKALAVAKKMADWTDQLLRPLSDQQLQKMLACEFGGMNDVLVNIYALTGEKKYLDLSYKFQHSAIVDPLAEGKDPLPGKHSNTQIPKIIGSASRYELVGDDKDARIARNFWDIIVHHHSYVIGGNSDHEYMADADRLSDYLSESTCETCNTYNMLKLTRHLFSWAPDSKLADFYERALYNHILASQNPKSAMMCYFVPLRMGTKKVFSDSVNTFTCCVGSGMENHSKYAESIYFEGADGSLYVNLFIPSQLNWKAKKVVVRQTTFYPNSDSINFTIQPAAPTTFTLRLRKPWWAKQGVKVLVNGKVMSVAPGEDGYLAISRKWSKGDKVQLIAAMDLYTEAMPDNSNRIAFLYGPLVLAGNLGTKELTNDIYSVPVLLTSDRDIHNWLKPVAGKSLTFVTTGVGKPGDVELSPFYQANNNYYSVYWDYFTPADWATREVEFETELKRQKDIENRTIDIMRLGEMQPEHDHNLKSENSYTDFSERRSSRDVRNGGFFSFDMKVLPGQKNVLLVTLWGGDNGRVSDIWVDGVKIASQELKTMKPNKFMDAAYAIPDELVAGKTKVEVKFTAPVGKSSGGIYGCRTLKGKE